MSYIKKDYSHNISPESSLDQIVAAITTCTPSIFGQTQIHSTKSCNLQVQNNVVPATAHPYIRNLLAGGYQCAETYFGHHEGGCSREVEGSDFGCLTTLKTTSPYLSRISQLFKTLGERTLNSLCSPSSASKLHADFTTV